MPGAGGRRRQGWCGARRKVHPGQRVESRGVGEGAGQTAEDPGTGYRGGEEPGAGR